MPTVGAPRHGFDYAAFGSRLESLWFQRKLALNGGRTTDARQQIEEIFRFCEEEGVGRLELFGSALTAEALRAIDDGRFDNAAEALDYAERFNPGQPPTELARAKLQWESGRGRLAAVAHAAKALRLSAKRAVGDLSFIPITAFVAVGAVLASLMLFAMLAVLRHHRCVRHDVAERLPDSLPEGLGLAAGWVVVLLPLVTWIGAGWTALYWIAVTFRYMGRAERTAATVLVIAVGLTGPAQRIGTAAYGITADPAARATLAASDGEYSPERIVRLQQLVEAHPEDPTFHFLLARLLDDGRYYEEAYTEYRKALELDPTLHAAHVNIGNIFFRTRQFGEATASYRRALELDPESFEAFFDTHLAQSEALRFDESLKSLERARSIDPERVSRILAGTSPRDTRLEPVESSLRTISIWGAATYGRQTVGVGSQSIGSGKTLDARGIMAILTLVAGFGSLIWSRRDPPARACLRCGHAFCERCRGGGEVRDYCSQCLHLFVIGEGLAVRAKARKLYQVEKHERLTRQVRNLLYVFLPGTRQILTGRSLRGVALLGLWLAGLLLVAPELAVPIETWSGAPLHLDLLRGGAVPARLALSASAAVGIAIASSAWIMSQLRTPRHSRV